MSDFSIVKTPEMLDPVSRRLIQRAQDALSSAYAPYSKFHVAAALWLDNQEIITGTNQENAAYPVSMCAERVALYAMVSQYPGVGLTKMAVVARRQHSPILVPATCCGSCRQVMLEFERRQSKVFEVIMQNQDCQWVKAPSVESLLPFSFSKSNLGTTNNP